MSDHPRPSLSEETARRRAFFIAWATLTIFLVLQNTANAFSEVRDLRVSDPREPFIWEATSGIVIVALVPGVAWLLRLAPPERGQWLRFGLTHLSGSLVFSVLHVSGFILIRRAVYALAGARYAGVPQWLYEYRKDFVTYFGFMLILAGADWAAKLWSRSRAVEVSGGRRLYQLKDGSRVLRVPLDEIVAVASARNYVEFHLADGGKPLVRETLSKVEADLSGSGFLRTHRSWLVNPAHVRAITPAAAGDFRLELDTGLTAPLSRRFPDALEVLRGPAPGAAAAAV